MKRTLITLILRIMKELNQEKFKQMLRKVRLHLGIMYFGASNNMLMTVKINGKTKKPKEMTDEEVVLLWQLCRATENMLVREQIGRDLLPDEMKQLYEQSPNESTSPTDNEQSKGS